MTTSAESQSFTEYAVLYSDGRKQPVGQNLEVARGIARARYAGLVSRTVTTTRWEVVPDD